MHAMSTCMQTKSMTILTYVMICAKCAFIYKSEHILQGSLQRLMRHGSGTTMNSLFNSHPHVNPSIFLELCPSSSIVVL